MLKLNIYYKIFDSDSIEKDKKDDPFYFFELNEETPCELTKEKVADFLSNDNVEKKYINDSLSIQYKLENQDNKVKNNFKELVQPYPNLEANKNYNLYLKIKIGKDSYSEEQEENIETQKEKDEIQKQYAEAKQILQGLKDIRIQIKNIKHEPIRKRKNSQDLKNKKFLEYQNQKVDDKKEQASTSNHSQTVILQPHIKIENDDEQPKDIETKVFFLYSFPLQKTGDNKFDIEILPEEDS